jgi:hypothetical protein
MTIVTKENIGYVDTALGIVSSVIYLDIKIIGVFVVLPISSI